MELMHRLIYYYNTNLFILFTFLSGMMVTRMFMFEQPGDWWVLLLLILVYWIYAWLSFTYRRKSPISQKSK